jgi:hypothetical protein
VFATVPPYWAAYVLKLGTAAAAFTALLSAERFALEDDALVVDVAVLEGVELDEVELVLEPPEEQPATASPPTTSTGITVRRRNLDLRTFSPSPTNFVHVCSPLYRKPPKHCSDGLDETLTLMFGKPHCPSTYVPMHMHCQRGLLKDLIPAGKIVNISVNMIAYHSGHYRDMKNLHPRKLCSSTVRREQPCTPVTGSSRGETVQLADQARSRAERFFKKPDYPQFL